MTLSKRGKQLSFLFVGSFPKERYNLGRVEHSIVSAFLLQDTGKTGEGRNESNDNPADSAEKVKTSSGDSEQMHAVSTSNDDSNDVIKDGVSNTQNQHCLINSK